MKRRVKRIVELMLLVVCIIMLSGSFTSVKASSNTFERNEKLVLMINEKLGQGSYTYEYLLDFENENRYILVKGDNCYLIFDTVLEDYVEFSRTDNPFYDELNQNCEKVYLAPTYYFYKDNGVTYDLYDNRQLTLTDINEYRLFEQDLENAYYQTKAFENGNKSGEDDPVYITNRYYFDNLRYNIGSNTTTLFSGSCSYVALGMLLAYYDSIENDNVIAEMYDVTSTKAFSSYSAIDVADYTASPGINDVFHAFLIQYGRNLGLTGTDSNSIAVSDMDELFEEYFEDRNLSITTHTTGLFTNKKNFCKSAINSDNPVLIAISGTDTSIDPDDIDHAVVGDGYDSSGIYAHFGWKYNYHTNTNINNYTINKAFYITFDSTHSHSDNYLWTYSGCNGTICPCGNKTCNHGSYYYNQFNMIRHKKICNACGHQQNENHHFQNVGGDQVCSDCGYTEANHTHSYLYSWKSYTQHRATCLCGDMHDEIHVVPAGSFQNGEQYATCLLCGGQATIGIVYPAGFVSDSSTLTNSVGLVLFNRIYALINNKKEE